MFLLLCKNDKNTTDANLLQGGYDIGLTLEGGIHPHGTLPGCWLISSSQKSISTAVNFKRFKFSRPVCNAQECAALADTQAIRTHDV
jgi:hypothetical protein